MRSIVMAAALTALLDPGSAAWAQAKPARVIGNFYVSEEANNFDPGSSAIALTGTSADVLALRCLQGEISIAVTPNGVSGEITPGDAYLVKFRADKGDIIDTSGTAVNKTMIQIASEETAAILSAIASANQAAFRITSLEGTATDETFPLRQADKVVALVHKDCAK